MARTKTTRVKKNATWGRTSNRMGVSVDGRVVFTGAEGESLKTADKLRKKRDAEGGKQRIETHWLLKGQSGRRGWQGSSNPGITSALTDPNVVSTFVPGVSAMQSAGALGRYVPTQEDVDKFVWGSRNAGASRRNPAEDIEFLNELAPSVSSGHIEFTQDGLERFVRDGYIYAAYSATPVQADGYRVGTPEGVADPDLVVANPGALARNPRSFSFAVVDTKSDWRETYHSYPQAVSDLKLMNKREGYQRYYLDKIADAEGQSPNPAKFDRCIRDVARSARPGTNAYAVCTAAGTGAPARNPAAEADALYESFHGAPPSETLEFTESEHVHGHLAGLGELTEIVVKLTGGTNAGGSTTLAADPATAAPEDIVHVSSNEEGSQIYFIGGDQYIDVAKLGFRESFNVKHDGEDFEASEIKDLMVLGEIQKLTYRTQKAFDDFETVDYFHKLGEDTKTRPFLLYDTLNDKMKIGGGEYHVHSVGVVN